MAAPSELIICTKDRPDDLRRCLESLAAARTLPLRVLVVDASAGDASAEVVRTVAPVLDTAIEYVHASPGLTHQRNVGIALLLPGTAIVHFVDDDVVVEPGYFAAMDDAFSGDPSVVGATGCITDLPPRRSRWWNRLALTDGPDGAVLRSGVNIPNSVGAEAHAVDWLSGCTMSIRCLALDGLAFDERRTGGGLGEDVDFSLRLAERGALRWVPDARLAHRQSPVNRASAAQVARRGVHHRWQLVADDVGPVRRSAVAWSAVASSIIGVVDALGRRRGRSMRAAIAPLLGLADVVLGRDAR